MSRDRIFRDAGAVIRYHAVPTIQQQSVAEHTWHILRIYIQIWGAPSPEATVHMVMHDAAELVVGDVPHPAKRRWPELRRMLHELEAEVALELLPEIEHHPVSNLEEWRIRVADLVEMWEFGQDEELLGSVRGSKITQTAGRVVLSMIEAPGVDQDEATAVRRYMERRQQQCRMLA